MATQASLFRVSGRERKRSLCSTCRGYRRLCGKHICPILTKAEVFTRLKRTLTKEVIYGPSPPAVFVGSWNYPKVLAGPLVPPFSMENAAIMDQPELWIDKSFDEILNYRFSLVRGKHFTDVRSAGTPENILSTFQEIVMASRPIETEMWFNKKPRLSIIFSPREPPSGPSASIKRAILAENPKVPTKVDHIVSDTDLKAGEGIVSLYSSNINQQQITRMFSIGLLGVKKHRRLVPTEWSITAVDDILGKSMHKEILNYPWINEFMVFGHSALANNIQILLLPSSWLFEAQEAWLITSNSTPEVNYEFVKGRHTYASNLAGAYYATRLPVLEYLKGIRRQAGAIVLMEVYPEWIPLGVWRFREICRQALREEPRKFNTLEGGLSEMGKRVKLPLARWLERSRVLQWIKNQTRLTKFLSAR